MEKFKKFMNTEIVSEKSYSKFLDTARGFGAVSIILMALSGGFNQDNWAKNSCHKQLATYTNVSVKARYYPYTIFSFKDNGVQGQKIMQEFKAYGGPDCREVQIGDIPSTSLVSLHDDQAKRL